MRSSEMLTAILKLAAETRFDDDMGLEVLGQCILVYTLLDPETEPDHKKHVASQIASDVKRSPRRPDAGSA